jgi:hypothetical protein
MFRGVDIFEKLKCSQESAAKIIKQLCVSRSAMATNDPGQAMVANGMLELRAFMEGV